MINKLRKEIRNILKENNILLELTYTPEKPLKYELHKASEKEWQYVFQTSNEFVYHLSILKTCVKTKEKKVLELYTNEIKEDGCLYFNAINFFASGKNPNVDNTFEEITNRREIITVIKNILWMISNFIELNPEEKYFLFAAEPQRLKIYGDVVKDLKNLFIVFPPSLYDVSYKYEMIILIKK